VQSVCIRRASWLQLLQRKCAEAWTLRSLVVIKVDRSTSSQYCASAFSAVSSGFFKPFSGNTLMVVVLFYCCLFCITLLSQWLRRTANTTTYCPTWLAVERATGIIINNSGKFEDLVLMIAKRQTYRLRDRDIIQTCYSIVFLTTSVLEAI